MLGGGALRTRDRRFVRLAPGLAVPGSSSGGASAVLRGSPDFVGSAPQDDGARLEGSAAPCPGNGDYSPASAFVSSGSSTRSKFSALIGPTSLKAMRPSRPTTKVSGTP